MKTGNCKTLGEAVFKNLINILTAPNDAFAAIRDKPTILVPLLLIAILTASVQYRYFQVVDRVFLIEQLIEQTQAFVNAPEDDRVATDIKKAA